MRWKTKRLLIGSHKKIKHFAWLPTECEDGISVWLEYYIADYQLDWSKFRGSYHWQCIRRVALSNKKL